MIENVKDDHLGTERSNRSYQSKPLSEKLSQKNIDSDDEDNDGAKDLEPNGENFYWSEEYLAEME